MAGSHVLPPKPALETKQTLSAFLPSLVNGIPIFMAQNSLLF